MNFWIEVAKGILVSVLGGIPSFLIGIWLYTQYVAPKQASDIAVKTADAIIKHRKVQPVIKKLERYEKELEPLIAKAKEIDFQEIIDMAKGLKVFIELQNKGTPPPPPPKRDKR